MPDQNTMPDPNTVSDQNNSTSENSGTDLTNDADPILLRLVYMVLFYFVYAVSRFVVGVVAIVQFLHLLLTESPQEDLLKFSRSLTRYIAEIVKYLTFVGNVKPFPFTEWPSDENQSQQNGED